MKSKPKAASKPGQICAMSACLVPPGLVLPLTWYLGHLVATAAEPGLPWLHGCAVAWGRGGQKSGASKAETDRLTRFLRAQVSRGGGGQKSGDQEAETVACTSFMTAGNRGGGGCSVDLAGTGSAQNDHGAVTTGGRWLDLANRGSKHQTGEQTGEQIENEKVKT